MIDIRRPLQAVANQVLARIPGPDRTVRITGNLQHYVDDTWIHEPPAARGLREATAAVPARGMQIGADHGRLLHWLAGTVGARRTIEVGVFTGYSALWTALALPEDGTLVACDVSEEWTSIGRPFWEQAGVAERIDLRLAPALETLDALVAEGGAGGYDLAFIDADKSSYNAYYERCLQLVRPGGIVAIDNVLWGGAVADPKQTDPDTEALRALNAKIATDDRVDVCLVPVGDGLTLTRRIAS
ncbi:MAG: class I SAM-dependent methyltransferase [Actinomycetota bacterium]